MIFEIECGPLTPGRRALLAPNEVAVVGRPLRLVLAAGGAYIFYYGTSPDVPVMVQSAANLFIIVGVAAILLAIFAQKLVETRYFSKALKEGCFPASVSVGQGGIYVRRAAESFFSFAEIGNIEEQAAYFKISLPSEGASGIYIFKEDFEQGEPEAFLSFIESHFRSK